MPETVEVYLKWDRVLLEEMSMNEFCKRVTKDDRFGTIMVNDRKYRIMEEAKRIPQKNGNHNDTFTTFVFVEPVPKNRGTKMFGIKEVFYN